MVPLYLLLLPQLFFSSSALAIPATFQGYSGEEKDALYSLKSAFNDTFLNTNWTGLHCYLNQPPLWYGIRCLAGRVTGISLADMALAGELSVDAFASFTQISDLNLKNNFITGSVYNFTLNRNLKNIDLSGNRFSGPIPISLLSLNSLESLQLQNNFLSSPIPEFNQASLQEFNVSNNNLNGSIPESLALQMFGWDSYFNNPGLCCAGGLTTRDSSETTTSDNSSDQHHKSRVPIVVMVLIIATCLVATFVLGFLYLKKSKQLKKIREEKKQIGMEESKRETAEKKTIGEKDGKAGESRKLIFIDGSEEKFELADLLKASAKGLGRGMFGNSYKAMLDGNAPVVVKRLRDLKPLSGEEFTKQIQFIAKLKHPNLLPLLAYYYSKDEKLLIFDYAENGSLFNRLHDGRGGIKGRATNRVPFRWGARLSVARAVARALEYLHMTNKTNNNAPHGNLKSSNVLLNENDVVLVTDYGMASLVVLPIAAQVMASFKSPEYHHTKKVSRKSDVWSYGCLILELLTGKLSINSAPNGMKGVDLGSWVHQAVREEWTAEIFDVEIAAQRSSIPRMLKLLQIAMRCCDKSPEKRPEMREVVREVEEIKVSEGEDEELSSSIDRSFADESLSSTTIGSNN